MTRYIFYQYRGVINRWVLIKGGARMNGHHEMQILSTERINVDVKNHLIDKAFCTYEKVLSMPYFLVIKQSSR